MWDVTDLDDTPSREAAAGSHGASVGVDEQVLRLLQLARTHLGMEIAWLSQFDGDRQVIRAVHGDAAAMNVAVGEGTLLEGSFCTRVLAGTLPPVIPHARRNPVTRELPVTQQLRIGSYVGAPLLSPGGKPLGMLCCLSRSPNPALTDEAPRFLAVIAELISDHLSSPVTLARRAADQDTADVQALLAAGRIRMVFQPVIQFRDRQVVALEALARFDHPRFLTPAHAFAAATQAGLGVQLEHLAIREALRQLPHIPDGVWLGVNLSAEALLDSDIQDTLLKHADRRVGVEITEHTQIDDYDRLTNSIRALRAASVQIAVDDAGAGYASFRHILRLRPDVIKLDLDITRGVDTDPVRQALARSLADFANEIGAILIAEGIESSTELQTLKRLGVGLGQGFFLAKPTELTKPGIRAIGTPAP